MAFIRIAKNLLEVPADILALVYFQRWTVEIFFWSFTQFLGCAHLISHGHNGMEIQVY
ncbi:hypothetical protein SAMN06265222_116129 [Neorhodopirellula lusitana]|uniref:Transposase n=1 Tax=Neorhodopirellula lusitana TaxID=445327 RepID=A0ABY1QMN7_9BACT|nr:hypothetical protein SAMN06265222_116129 [Neorhodopirellula lusitana]